MRGGRVGSEERKRKRTDRGKGFLTRSRYRRQTGSMFWLKPILTSITVVLLSDIFIVSPIPAAAAITQTRQQVTQYQSGQRAQSRSPEGPLTLPAIIVRMFHSRGVALASPLLRSASLLPSGHSLTNASLHPANYQLGGCF